MAYSSIIAGAKAAGATIAPILESIVALASNGLIVRTSSTTVAARTITGVSGETVVTNGDGVSGNPTIGIGANVVTLTGTQTLSNKTFSNDVTLSGAPGRIKPAVNSTTALQIANAAASPFVTFDTTNARVGIGTTAPEAALHLQQASINNITLFLLRGTQDAIMHFDYGSGNDDFGVIRFQRNGTTIWTIQSGGPANNMAFNGNGANTWSTNASFGIGTTSPANRLHVALDAASTTGVLYPLRIDRTVTGAGVGANDIGVGLEMYAETSTATQLVAQLSAQWTNATNASRTSRVRGWATDSAATREAISWGANGSASILSFHANAPIARPTITGSRGGNAALADLLTQLANYGLITDGTSA